MNWEAIQEAILATDASPLARETAAGLVQAYVEQYAESDAQKFHVLDVERPWFMWLEPNTLLVGQKDARLQDSVGHLLLELKTKREGRRTKSGDWYKGEGPLDWLEGISNGPQLGIYALHEAELTGAETIRIMVRCAVKSSPVVLWPENEADGIFLLNRDYLRHLRSALVVKAAQIRAARASGQVPWQWIGYHCLRMFGKECQHYQPTCKVHLHPTGRVAAFSETDPGYAAVKGALAERGWDEDRLHDPELVILSASAYESYSRCMEMGRIEQDGLGGREDSEALQTGSCFHAGVAQFYRSLIVPNPSLEGVAQSTT